MIFDYVCFIAEWSILGTTHHRIVPNDRASRFLHWRRKRKLKPLMLAVSLALIHSVGSFTGIYSEKTLYKSAIVFERIPPSVESAKECKGTKEPSGCWWEMMHGARCTPDVLGQCIGIWCDPVEKTYIYIYLYIYYYIIVRFDEVCVSFMDSEKDCQCSKSFSIFRNKATCQRQWCTWMYAEL